MGSLDCGIQAMDEPEPTSDAEGVDAPQTEGGTEQRIFDAALHVFARKGHDGARLQEIADEAGINRALLHYYFRNKSQLYEAVFAHGFRQFLSGFRQVLETGQTFEETLKAFVHGYIGYVHEHQDHARLMLNECLCGGPFLTGYLTEAMSSRGEFPAFVMLERIEAAIEHGEIRPVDPRHTMLTIVSACLFSFVAAPTVRIFHPEVEDDFEAFVDARKKHVVDLVLRGLVPEPPEAS